MSASIEGLSPRILWTNFARLAAIPRPSGSEAAAAAFVAEAGRAAGAEVRKDAAGNVVLSVPASPGRASARTVILQTHLDMVCEKNAGVDHDFDRDPIRPRVDGEWVQATGTTLGADNGIGVAAALATATDPELRHGPLELLFTVDEETGLTGAKRLDPSLVSGRVMLNLDSEEDGVIYVGCAGGEDTVIDLAVARTKPAAASGCRLEVKGLRGGHSGLNIAENRGNALKLLARILLAAIEEGVAFELASVRGGSKHNAIPREAEAVLAVAPDMRVKLEGVVACQKEGFAAQLAGIDDGLTVACSDAPTPKAVLSAPDRDRAVRLLAALPHGVLGMSRDIPGLVETSSNLAVAAESGERLRVVTSSRSSVAPTLRGVLAGIRAAAVLAGGEVTPQDGYPGWKPNMSSPALAVVRDVYRKRWGREPVVTAIHAGLECGLLGEKIPDLDMVSFGPQIEGAHSPDERVHVPSVERFWGALGSVLDRLSS